MEGLACAPLPEEWIISIHDHLIERPASWTSRLRKCQERDDRREQPRPDDLAGLRPEVHWEAAREQIGGVFPSSGDPAGLRRSGGSRRMSLGCPSGRATLHFLGAALVRPLVGGLGNDADHGYLEVRPDLVSQSKPLVDPEEPAADTNRWRLLTESLLDHEAVRMHRRLLAMPFTFREAARRGHTKPSTDSRAFTAELIDLVTAPLASPPSGESPRVRLSWKFA